jgi:hypothetical protein
MIYDFLFDEDPAHDWVLYLKGYEWGPSSLPLIISHRGIWPGIPQHRIDLVIPQHQIGLFKACRQTQTETRPLLMNTGKDDLEFWGITALNRFNQTYPHVQLTSLTLVAKVKSELINPGDSHSADLDAFLRLLQNSWFPQLKTMKLLTNEWREHKFDILDGRTELEGYLDRLRIIIDGYMNRLHDIVKSRNMKLSIHCMTWDCEPVLIPTVLSAEGIKTVGW